MTIADYRDGEIVKPDAAHVQRWVEQFDGSVRAPLLEELDHVLKQTYVSRAEMRKFLTEVATTPKFTGGDHAAFWKQANILRLQDGTKSQHDMLQALEAVIKQELGPPFGPGSDGAPFIYVDDGRAKPALGGLRGPERSVQRTVTSEGRSASRGGR